MSQFKNVIVILFCMNAVLFFSGYGSFEDEVTTGVDVGETTTNQAQSMGSGAGFSLAINMLSSFIGDVAAFFKVPLAITLNSDLPIQVRTMVGTVYGLLLGFGAFEWVFNR